MTYGVKSLDISCLIGIVRATHHPFQILLRLVYDSDISRVSEDSEIVRRGRQLVAMLVADNLR